MARVHYWQYIVDEEGRPVNGVEVGFYLEDTTKETSGLTEAQIYVNPSVGHTTTTSAIGLETDIDGYFEFWVGDKWESEGGYESTQRFRLTWYKAGMARGIINNVDLYPPLYEIDETLTGQSPAAEAARRNKLISNNLAYRWEDHVESQVPSASPHNIRPVIVCSPDIEYNKVVSNELMNKIYTVAVSASITTLDASGADVDFSRINLDHQWNASGSLYYADITHNLGNEYPILQVVDTITNNAVMPETLQSLDINTTRVVFSSSASQYMVTAIG